MWKHHSDVDNVEVMKELIWKVKLIYSPTLTHGDELWGMSKTIRSQVEPATLSFLHRMTSLTSGDSRVQPPHGKQPVEVFWAFSQDCCWMPSRGGISVMSPPKEALGADPDLLERLYLSVGLEKPLCGGRGNDWKEELWRSLLTWFHVSGRKWMAGYLIDFCW